MDCITRKLYNSVNAYAFSKKLLYVILHFLKYILSFMVRCLSKVVSMIKFIRHYNIMFYGVLCILLVNDNTGCFKKFDM